MSQPCFTWTAVSDSASARGPGTWQRLAPKVQIIREASSTAPIMPERGNSRVTVSFEPAGAGTKLVLFQEQLPTAETREAHTAGWTGCLSKLVKLLS